MQNSTQQKPPTETQKKYIYLSFLLLLCCAVAATTFICQKMYDVAEKDFLAEQNALLHKDVRDTVTSVVAWRDDLKNQASRVSTSELYRLFALEASQLDPRTMGLLNEAENIPKDSSDLAMLAEQVPLMRNVLLDFMNYVGFTDARIATAGGNTLLSVYTYPTAMLGGQVTAVRTAIDRGKLTLTPVREGPSSLLMDMADPLQPVMSGEGRDTPVAALLLTMPVTGQVGRFISTENRMTEASLHILQRNADLWEDVRVRGVVKLPALVQDAVMPDKDGLIPFALRTDVSGKAQVYSLGLPVAGMPWWVMAEMPAALVANTLRQKALSIALMGGLACLGFVLMLPLLWWLAVGRGQHAMALRFRELYHTIQQQKQLLDGINMSLEAGLFMVDAQGKIHICNPAFAAIVRVEDDALLQDKNLFVLFKGESSEKLLAGMHTVLRENKSTTFEVECAHEEDTYLYRTTLFPFINMETGETTGAVGTMQDITDFRRRARQQQRQQLHTMSAFMRAIESIDPYLAGHSQMMRALGAPVAASLQLDDRDTRTIVTAAELSQVGKISLPQALLHKEGPLTAEELAEFRRVPQYAYSILKDIPFDLPVAEAVYAMNETMDGKGYPCGLNGADICIHARVLAVLNAFCAMTSPRSYREGQSLDQALDILSRHASFDQTVVSALRDVLYTAEGAEIFRQRRLARQKEKEAPSA